MEAPSVKRKLAAILAADVKGYSRLMSEDEEATLHTLNTYRGVTDPLIAQHGGRVVSTAGDSILAEFASVVDAVRCAVEIQRELKIRNTNLPAHRQMEFRIGINLGDVMVDGEQIYGDGVNIAARLESLAEAGGICISGTVYEQIENKLSLQYEDLGEQTVKNIAKPVRVWRIRVEESGSPASGVRSPASEVPSPQPRRVGIARRHWAVVVVGLLLIAGTLLIVWHLFRPTLSTQDSTLRTEAAPAALPLPDKPSLAVLPFANMSNNPEQDYFSDGITEVLITDLSKISGLFVIARNSTFTYKGKAVKVQDVGRELGVRYVLEGSVLRSDDQVRITAQLVDASTGHHLWAERYDRPLKDISAVQDEVVQRIVTTLNLQFSVWERGLLLRRATDNLEAYDYLLRGTVYGWRGTKEATLQARQVFEKAINLDPNCAQAYAAVSMTHLTDWSYQWSQDPQQSLEKALETARQAVTLNDALPEAHFTLGNVLLWEKQYDQAITETERAIALDPNFANAYAWLGFTLGSVGRPEEALGAAEKAMRLNPRYPPFYSMILGRAHALAGRYEKAVPYLKSSLSRNPNLIPAHYMLVVAYSELGQEGAAQAEVAELQRISPNFSLEGLRQRAPFKDPVVLERHLAALRKAGLK